MNALPRCHAEHNLTFGEHTNSATVRELAEMVYDDADTAREIQMDWYKRKLLRGG